MKTEYSKRDNDAKVTFYVPLWKRKGVTQEMFDDYWRDVHGPVCARLPGQFQYWQFHVEYSERLLPAIEGVNLGSDPEDRFSGIAELTFKSVEDRNTWLDASKILMDDEHNIFSKAIGYVTELGNSKTYTDGIEDGEPNGSTGTLKFHVMVRKHNSVNSTDFKNFMVDTFANSISKSNLVLKFRMHIFEPIDPNPDASRPGAEGVSHNEPLEKQFQAAYEIAFKNNIDMEQFFKSNEYHSAVKEMSRYVKETLPFREKDPYTFVYNGKMTMAGLRGSRTAHLISDIGATNQLKDDIRNLILGKGSAGFKNAVLDDKDLQVKLSSINPKFGDFCTRVAGEVWGYPLIDQKTKALITIAVDVVNQTEYGPGTPFGAHVNMAMKQGATKEEIEELLLFMCVYAGFNKAPGCFGVLNEILGKPEATP